MEENKISQTEVIEILEKADKPLSRTEIAEQLMEDVVKISHCLKRMLKYDEIKCIEINRKQAMKLYGCKRRMRIYYI